MGKLGGAKIERDAVWRVLGVQAGRVLSLEAGGGVCFATFGESLVAVSRKRGSAGDVLDGRGELSLNDEFDDIESFAVVGAEILEERSAPARSLFAHAESDTSDSGCGESSIGKFGVGESSVVGEYGRTARLGGTCLAAPAG